MSGLAANFHCAMKDAGWKCEENGVISHVSGVHCNWVDDSIPYVCQCLDKAWESTIASLVNRKGFDLSAVSAKGFNDAIKHRGPQQQGLLVTVACGKHVTMDALSHYAKTDPTCPFCSAIDGKEHRALHCHGLHDLHVKHKEAIQWVKTQPKGVLHFGLMPDTNEAVLLRQSAFNTGLSKVMPPHNREGDVFTDGTCYNSTSWEHAIAGAAVIEVTGDYQWRLVCRSLLPTPDHSSYRGETFAIILALQNFWKVHIHSDCAAVVDEVQRLLQLHACGESLFARSHHDLWNVVAWHIQQRRPDDIQISKVKAHVDWHSLEPGRDRLSAFYNAMVDLEAKKSVAADHFDLWQRLDGLMSQRKDKIAMLVKYHDFIWDVHQRSFNVQPRSQPREIQPSFAELWTFQGSGSRICAPSMTDLDACPFGKKFAMRVLAWWNQLVWFPDPAVSVLELYIDYCFESCS